MFDHIKLYDQFLDWGWFHDSECVHLLIYLMLKARKSPGKFRSHNIARGELVAGRGALSAATGLAEQVVRTRIMRMVDSGEIELRRIDTDKGVYGVIKVVKYSDFQKPEQKKVIMRDQVKIYTEYTPDFNRWWAVYKKGIKRNALQPWMRNIDTLPPIDELIKSTEQYIAYCVHSERQMMDGQGWINQRYFENEWTHQGQGTEELDNDSPYE